MEAQESIVSQVISEPKLWAGKYKTPEELEKAYGHSVNAFVEKSKLEKELENYRTPESYTDPEGLSFREEDLREIKEIAKNANLSQKQFELTAKEMHNRMMANSEYETNYIEERKKSIGEENINILSDYVEKNYPSSVREVVFNKLLKDESAMSEALKDRDQRLNSQVPGIGRGTGATPSYDGQRELQEACKAWNREPHNPALRDKFIHLSREVGHERMRNK